MATFADFALLRSEPSYGGAEVLRARRITARDAGDPVHLALFGDLQRDRAARLASVAQVAAQTAHDQIARIVEVGVFGGASNGTGALYAAGAPAEGVDVASLLEHERRKKQVPDVSIAIALSLQLAQIAVDLQERGDVWAQEGATGLSALFPAGLRLDALVVERSGTLKVRILAGASADPARPTAFRAPELRTQKATVASDVFLVAQTLRALLTGDASATSAPRMQSDAAHLGSLLAAALAANPDERLGLFMLVERLSTEMKALAGKSQPAQVAASFLKREYRALVPAEAPDLPHDAAAAEVRARLRSLRAALDILWPRESTAPSKPSPRAGLPPVGEPLEDEPATMQMPMAGALESSSAVGRVFDDADDEVGPTVDLRLPKPGELLDTDPPTRPVRATSGAATVSGPSPPAITMATDPPWISMSEDFALVDASSSESTTGPADIARPRVERAADPRAVARVDRAASEAFAAPPPSIHDVETGPTIEMQSPDVDDATTDEHSKKKKR